MDSKEIIEKSTYIERINICKKHFKYLLEIKNEKTAVLEMRSQIAWYTKGMTEHKDINNMILIDTSEVDIHKLANANPSFFFETEKYKSKLNIIRINPSIKKYLNCFSTLFSIF